MFFPYNVGDTVLVRDDMYPDVKTDYYSKGEHGEYYTRCYDEHYMFRGQLVTIAFLDENDGAYKIEEDEGDVWWAAEMFLPADITKRETDISLLMNVITGE